MRKIILPLFYKAELSPSFKAYASMLRKFYVHHIRYLQSDINPFERLLNIEFLGLLSTTKLLKFKISKNEKSIASNLENIKKRKEYSLDLHKKFTNETIFKEILLSCENMLADSQVTIRYKMRSRAI